MHTNFPYFFNFPVFETFGGGCPLCPPPPWTIMKKKVKWSFCGHIYKRAYALEIHLHLIFIKRKIARTHWKLIFIWSSLREKWYVRNRNWSSDLHQNFIWSSLRPSEYGVIEDVGAWSMESPQTKTRRKLNAF